MSKLLPVVSSSFDLLFEDSKVSEELYPSFQDPRPKPPEITKPTVSYSEISTWLECNHKHKLKYISLVELDGPTEHTEFGQVIHDIMEEYLQTKVIMELTKAHEMLNTRFAVLPNKESLKPKDWHNQIPQMIDAAVLMLDTQFPGWEFIAAELPLLEEIPKHHRLFKGFVDGIIRVPKKPRKGSKTIPEGFEYWILDWKSCGRPWSAMKRRDWRTQLQLALYKHFLIQKFGWPIEDVRCAFVLMSRSGKNRCELLPVSVGPKTLEKAVQTLYMFLGAVQKGWGTKNKEACKYCPYNNTIHCVK